MIRKATIDELVEIDRDNWYSMNVSGDSSDNSFGKVIVISEEDLILVIDRLYKKHLVTPGMFSNEGSVVTLSLKNLLVMCNHPISSMREELLEELKSSEKFI